MASSLIPACINSGDERKGRKKCRAYGSNFHIIRLNAVAGCVQQYRCDACRHVWAPIPAPVVVEVVEQASCAGRMVGFGLAGVGFGMGVRALAR